MSLSSLLWLRHMVFLMLGLACCGQVVAQNDSLSARLRVQLSGEEVSWAEQALAWPQLRAFYAPNYQPVWVAAAGLTERAQQWRRLLGAAASEGLEPERYHWHDIEQYWQAALPQQKVWLELLLTDAFLHYAVHVRTGRLEPTVLDPDWHLGTTAVDAVSLLRQALAATDFEAAVRALPPPHAGYRRLREALARYRQLATKDDWPVLPVTPKLQWGMWHDNIPLLRRRLILSGDLSARQVQAPRFFDQSLKQAVAWFQYRHGLKADGIVGRITIASLNRPLREHVRQIKLNMERWRWLPRELGERYILVNTASYQLQVIEHGKPRLAMRVITGTPERPTPVMAGRMQSVIINPYWYVPKTIAIEDLIPKQRANPGFFRAKHLRVMTGLTEDAVEVDPARIDWAKIDADHFPYILRQDPGPGNSLGSLKFPFVNSFAIYLHDTPQQHLFGYARRAFSSGCVRVEQPLHLARYLLNGEQGWTSAKLREKIASGETLTISLPEPIPIYLVYLTVWVGPDNTIYFQKDIYDRDRPMAECG